MMPNPTPTVSVVMPVFNAENYVAEAVRSVQEQGVEALEILCVDDGSTDASAAVLRSLNEPRLRLWQQSNAGPAAARNRALAEARGDFIAFLDADDWWPPQKLTWQLAALRHEPTLEAVTGLVRYVFDEGAPPRTYHFTHPDNRLFYYQVGAGLFRRSVFSVVGRFDETLRRSEDVDWFLRLKEVGVALKAVEETALCYRLHTHNTSNGHHAANNQLLDVLRQSLARRRAGPEAALLRRFSDHR